MQIKVRVTKKHIDLGRRGRTNPVERAVQQMLKPSWRVKCQYGGMVFVPEFVVQQEKGLSHTLFLYMPVAVENWLFEYDRRPQAQPRTLEFTLTVNPWAADLILKKGKRNG